jgi:HNH endonuclease/NUMOD4 motif
MEKWSPVKGYEGRYSVSNHGRVLSHRKSGDRFLKPGIEASGYCLVVLCVNGIHDSRKVHRLVAEHFIGPCPKGLQVNHKDGNKNNNHETNLEYVSFKENIAHAKINGLNAFGVRAARSKLKECQVRKIRKMSHLGSTNLAKKFNVSAYAIRDILSGKTWRQLK